MTTEEAIEAATKWAKHFRNASVQFGAMGALEMSAMPEEAADAIDTIKAALADATALAERAEKACRAVRLTLGLTLGELLPGQQKITAKEIREAAERAYAAANLDAPATGEERV